jgi:hypothetical protein
LYDLAQGWEQKNKASSTGFVAPALLPVINLVERRRPRLRIGLTCSTYVRGKSTNGSSTLERDFDFPFFENVGNLVCRSSYCGGI